MKNPLSNTSENVKNLVLLLVGAIILGMGIDMSFATVIVPGIATILGAIVMFLKNNGDSSGGSHGPH